MFYFHIRSLFTIQNIDRLRQKFHFKPSTHFLVKWKKIHEQILNFFTREIAREKFCGDCEIFRSFHQFYGPVNFAMKFWRKKLLKRTIHTDILKCQISMNERVRESIVEKNYLTTDFEFEWVKWTTIHLLCCLHQWSAFWHVRSNAKTEKIEKCGWIHIYHEEVLVADTMT